MFTAPSGSEKIVKRVIGLPGDDVKYLRKDLIVNGEVATKSVERKLSFTDPADLLLEQVVSGRKFEILEAYGQSLNDSESKGPGYFVLGDNRDESTDSRIYDRLADGEVDCRAVAVLGNTSSGTVSFQHTRWL